MINDSKKILLLAFLITYFFLSRMNLPVYSQSDWAKPEIKFMHRLDLRHLGYPQVNEIPANSSAITSLLTSASGLIYGGTSGESSYLFLYIPLNETIGR